MTRAMSQNNHADSYQLLAFHALAGRAASHASADTTRNGCKIFSADPGVVRHSVVVRSFTPAGGDDFSVLPTSASAVTSIRTHGSDFPPRVPEGWGEAGFAPHRSAQSPLDPLLSLEPVTKKPATLKPKQKRRAQCARGL
jgi:hypothetical protein